MGKDKLPLDILGEVAQSKPEKTNHKEGISSPQEGQQGGNEGAIKAHMKKYNICLHEKDWLRLKSYFDNLGVPVRTGIRSIIKAYMNEQGIL